MPCIRKTEGKRRIWWQSMRCLDSISNSLDMGLAQNLRDPGMLQSMGLKRFRHDLVIEQQWGKKSWNEEEEDNDENGYELCVLNGFKFFVIPRTVACHTLLSMEFPRQEYWSGLRLPFARELPNPGIKRVSPMSPSIGRRILSQWATWVVVMN